MKDSKELRRWLTEDVKSLKLMNPSLILTAADAIINQALLLYEHLDEELEKVRPEDPLSGLSIIPDAMNIVGTLEAARDDLEQVKLICDGLIAQFAPDQGEKQLA